MSESRDDEEAVEREWSEAMRLALSNGMEPHTKKLVSLIDLRFRSLGRRERERHQETSESLARMEEMMLPIVSTYQTAMRIGAWAVKGAGAAGAVVGVATGVAKGMGWL